MVTIRLSRRGKKNTPFFHIVAVDKAKKRDGAVLAKIGTYDPSKVSPQEKVKVDFDLYSSWIAKGAQPSETVVQLVKNRSK